jgi:hypothetical protein
MQNGTTLTRSRGIRMPSSRVAVTIGLCLMAPGALTGQEPDSVLATSADATGPASADSMLAFQPLAPSVVLHLDHLTSAFTDTPEGRGLVPVGMDEARIAIEHARLAGLDSLDLASMVGNMTDVLHALDPDQAGSGAGLGYGVKRAAEGVIRHMELAISDPDATDAVRFHGAYVIAGAEGAIERADRAISLARAIRGSGSPADALPRIAELLDVLHAMAYGTDSDSDGRIGYTEDEMGLAQAQYHLALLRRAARLGA